MWSQICAKMAYIVRKITQNFFLSKIQIGVNFWSLRTLWHNLHMFLDILELRVEHKQKLLRENGFENLVSAIQKKNEFCP